MGALRGATIVGLFAGALLALAGCASSSGGGVTHTVEPGETLYRISRYYEVPLDRVIRTNRIDDVASVPVGRKLWIPGARKASAAHPLPLVVSAPASVGAYGGRRETGLDLAWPLRGRLSSRFGRRRGRPHEGIDIPARRGTPIRAAESGRVIHSGGGLGDYGQVVIVKHSGPYKTVYAHNRKNRVRKGEFVEKGEIIAEVGATGNASGPHLHFEVRRAAKPVDPLLYLP
ncbi:MAG: LysM peptidoglycan-binding domain-containing M23 family metallopeptidase [Myxococcales bacterium]|nr:LysM peptidoglycan-binding domain-containing M23 family metallopeptidase [Myxococcales bacterium]